MIALALAIPLAFVATPPLEYQVPRNDGWVTDQAKLLSPAEESALEARLEDWKKRTGHQIAVLTIQTLGDESLEEASIAVARAWGVGSGERSDGALLFVAQADRKMRIEVGDGLEGALTDSISGRIIRDVIAPKFRARQFGAGVRAGVESMIGVVEGGVEAVPALQGRGRGEVAGKAFALFIALLIVMAIAANARRTRGGRGWGSTGPLTRRGGFGGFGGFSTRSGGGGGGFSGFGGGGFSGGGASGSW